MSLGQWFTVCYISIGCLVGVFLIRETRSNNAKHKAVASKAVQERIKAIESSIAIQTPVFIRFVMLWPLWIAVAVFAIVRRRKL